MNALWVRVVSYTSIACGAVILSVMGSVVYRSLCPPMFTSRAEADMLSEALAVSLTSNAVAQSGRPVREYQALAWGERRYHDHAERLFARNELDPESGYVLWQHQSKDPSKTLCVRVCRSGDMYQCRVHEAK